MAVQLLKKFYCLSRNQKKKSITIRKTPAKRPCIKQDESIPHSDSFKIHLNFISDLRLCVSVDIFPTRSPPKILYEFLISSMCRTYTTQFNLHALAIFIIFREDSILYVKCTNYSITSIIRTNWDRGSSVNQTRMKNIYAVQQGTQSVFNE